jgi:hypothetical protein
VLGEIPDSNPGP